MKVRVVHLGTFEEFTVEQVLDEGRTLVVDATRFTLRRVNGHFVRDGEPSHGTRAVLIND